MTKLIFILTLLLTSLVASLGRADSMGPEALSDVDFSHLSQAPVLNWGQSPFSKTPGFITINTRTDDISPDQYHLGGIIYDKFDPVAVINGETVGIGDELEGGLHVEAVAPNYVVISGLGHRFELTLGLTKAARKSAEIKRYRASQESDQ
jgi:hypothetical protein